LKHLLTAAALLIGSSANAADLVARDAWIPTAPPSVMSRAAYVTLENTGASPMGIVSVSAEGFGMAHLHESKMQADGVMSMSAVMQLDIAPGTVLDMAPGGLHIMLMHGHTPLAEGEAVALTLTLTDGSTLLVDAVVKPSSANDS